MAGSNFFALFDDIAALLDDIALMSKVATKKTVGVLSDDLALNAQQVSGVHAARELPVVWAVAKGSLLNKCILVPAALMISWLLPWLITPLLMLGGAYLCFEGAEKIAHMPFHKGDEKAGQASHKQAVIDDDVDLVAYERRKIKGAIRTDFILSAEIIVIALGTMADASFIMRALVLSVVAFALTIGVYGAVAMIVKMDDAGLLLYQKASRLLRALGKGLLWFAPKLMRGLSILGTVAMFLVGGGILLHGLSPVAEALHHVEAGLPSIPLLPSLVATLANALLGLFAGTLLVALFHFYGRFRR